jgi:hypothetical protein
MSWGRTWVPKECKYERFDSSNFAPDCPQLANGGNILFLGDSGAARGLYCLLHSLLVGSSEMQPSDNIYGNPETVGCGGLWAESMRNNATYHYPNHESTYNETHYLRSTASMNEGGKVFHFKVLNLTVQWAYAYGLHEFGAKTWITAINSATMPTDVVLGAGIFDYGNGMNHAFWETVSMRRSNMLAVLLAHVKQKNPLANVWYSGSICNNVFPAAVADISIESGARRSGVGLIPNWPISAAHWNGPESERQTVDLFHYDRYPWYNKSYWHNRPHVGELSIAVLQGVLNALCHHQTHAATSLDKFECRL